jgi:hypothetical protein
MEHIPHEVPALRCIMAHAVSTAISGYPIAMLAVDVLLNIEAHHIIAFG